MPESPVTYVWEVLRERGFRALRDQPRFYADRAKAEAAVAARVEVYRDEVIDNMLWAIDDDQELWDEADVAWWLRRPAVTVHRTKDMTFYCLGDPNADSRDRCSAALGWIQRRDVVL